MPPKPPIAPQPFFPARTTSPLFHDLKDDLIIYMNDKVQVAKGETSHFWPDFEKLVTNPGRPLLRTAPVNLDSLRNHGHRVDGHLREESQQILQKHAAELPTKLADFFGDCIDRGVLEPMNGQTKASIKASVASHVAAYLTNKEIVVAQNMRPREDQHYRY